MRAHLDFSQQITAKILVVDPEPDILDQTTVTLTGGGYLCHPFTTVEAALAEVEILQPDLIVTEINLHGTSGVQMCQRIHQCPGLAEVPVIFLSAAQVPDIIRRRDDGRGTYYVRKPFDAGILLDLIAKTLPDRVPARVEC